MTAKKPEAREPETRQAPAIAPHYHIIASIADLERMTASNPVGNIGYVVGHIQNWLGEGKTASEKALPKIALSDQQRLINVLLKILDPRETRLQPFTSPYNGESDLQAVAKVRGKALEVLKNLDDQYRTYFGGIMPCLGEVGDKVCALVGNVIIDHTTTDHYHATITQWPEFLRQNNTQYRGALTAMHGDALRSGDTPRMDWINAFLRPESVRVRRAPQARAQKG